MTAETCSRGQINQICPPAPMATEYSAAEHIGGSRVPREDSGYSP
jgi:hypothetical protein